MAIFSPKTLFKYGHLAALGLILCAYAQAQTNLLFPMAPASFPESTYQGQSGCAQNIPELIFAITKNEGLDYIGLHPQVQVPKDGVFGMIIYHHSFKNYGYILEYRGQGKRCINQKIFSLKLDKNIDHNIPTKREITPEDCTFAPQVINLCGTLQQLIERLEKGGYRPDWQAVNEDGHTLTMLSGTGQSWILTTHKDTGATIFTGAGKGEFSFLKQGKDIAK